MPEKYHILPQPCSTCPYAKATPPGIWHPEEYEKLPRYDERELTLDDDVRPLLRPFGCHNRAVERDTLCRGWLSVHGDSLAVRVLILEGKIKPSDVPPENEPGLYASGREACDAGLAGCQGRLLPEAEAAQNKITRTRAKRAGS